MRAKQGGDWVQLSYRELGRADPGSEPRPARAGHASRRPGRDPLGEPSGVGHRGLRLSGGALHRRADLPDPARQAGRVHPARLGRGRRVGLDATAAGEGRWRCGIELPALRHVIGFDRTPRAPACCRWSEVCASGPPARPTAPGWKAEALQVKPDDLATLIYTSGTTGDPKGVMLTHGNIASNVTTCVRPLQPFATSDECLSFLPLSHIFERMFGHYCMFHSGVVINYAESMETVRRGHAAMAPDADGLGAAAVREDLRPGAGAVRAQVGGEAAAVLLGQAGGRDWVERVSTAGRPTVARARGAARLADRLVFAKLRARTGGRIRFFISGGAPLSADIARFFLRRRDADPRRVRADRDLAGHGGEHLRAPQARHRRPPDPGGRNPDRARTARSSPAGPT